MNNQIKFGLAGLLLAATFSMNAQTQTGSQTGLGLSTGCTSPNIGGKHVTFIGYRAGSADVLPAYGNDNTYVGHRAGEASNNGDFNTFIGSFSGTSMTSGAGNVFLGANTGGALTSCSNQLFIDNSPTTTPLVWGDFTTGSRKVKLNGKVGIGAVGTFPVLAGTANVSAYQLFVTGGILTEEVRVVSIGGWADFVFDKGYDLAPLSAVEAHIKDHGHLPNMPSAEEVCTNGIDVAEMATLQQQKIEELTLYLIAQDKEIQLLKEQVQALIAKK